MIGSQICANDWCVDWFELFSDRWSYFDRNNTIDFCEENSVLFLIFNILIFNKKIVH